MSVHPTFIEIFSDYNISKIFFYSEKETVLGSNLIGVAEKGLKDYLFVEGALVDEKNDDGMYCNKINLL